MRFFATRSRAAARVRPTIILALLLAFVPAAAVAHDPVATTRRATVADRTLRGLVAVDAGRCAGGYRIEGTDFCTHGPDLRPAGRRLSVQPPTPSTTIEGPLPGAVVCDGDGTSGKRVQAIYARTAATTSRYATLLREMREWAAGIQSTFLTSAARTDGVRRPRWVTDGDCRLKVLEVVLSDAARSSFSSTISELQALGHYRADRKYLVWFDASVYCGIGTFWGDDRPSADNLSNTQPGYARVDSSCWGWAESHELMHNLGAVQNTAPHSTYHQGSFGHCSDEYDVMCYPDKPGVVMTTACPDTTLDGQFDCGNDDYFHTDPAGGSYLGGHWNTADSGWLERTVVSLVPPRLRLVAGATVTGSTVPARAVYASSPPLSGVESVGVQRTTAAGDWTGVGHADDAVAVRLDLSPGRSHRVRVRAVDGGGIGGAWLTGPAAVAVLRQETHASLSWSAGWRRVARAGAAGGWVRRSASAGARVTLSTHATDIAVVAPRGPDRGKLEVWIDGARVKTVDLYAAAPVARQVVYARAFATGGRHRVRLRVTGTHREASSGSRVEIDAIGLLLAP